MANPSKQKGTKFETSLLPALRRLDAFGRVERSALKGSKDAGDFTQLSVKVGRDHEHVFVVVSAKNCKQMDLSGWLNEVEKQRKNGMADAAVVVHKKRGVTKPEDQYVTMTLGTLLALLT